MKKIYYLIAMAFMALTFTSCEDVPEPYGQPVSPKKAVVDPEGSGSVSDPYNVAGAIAKCKEIGDAVSSEKFYVKGYAATEGKADADYGNASFYLSDFKDGSGKRFYAYQVTGSDGQKMKDGYTIKVGDEVVIYGPMYNYNNKTPETASKGAAYIVTVNGQKTENSGGDAPAGEAKGKGTQSDPFNVAAAIAKCKEIGTTESTEKYYVKGKVVADATPAANYGNVTFKMVDEDGGAQFTAFQVMGSDGKKMPSTYKIPKGAEVVVYGPIYNYSGNTPETAGKGAAYIVTVNGQKTEVEGGESGGGGDVTPGTPKGTGTEADPFNVAAAVAKCKEVGTTASTESYYIKGITAAEYTVDSYKNVTVDIVDTDGATEKFTVYRVKDKDGKGIKEGYKIAKGATIIVYGPIMNYKGNTPETATGAYLVSVNGQAPVVDDGTSGGGNEGGGGTSGGSTATTLENGNFETWADGQPTGWKSASSASNATLAQSTDAHGGSYSCNVNGNETQNKRLASKEIKLAAGTYTFSIWVKATTSDAAQARPGFVPIGDDGKAGSYTYGDYANLSTSWQQVSYDFTLEAETTVCLVVMNPKKSNYSSGKDILVDDATLTKK